MNKRIASFFAKIREIMHIVFCLDNYYIPYCATTIASIIDNNQAERITFHLFVDEITDANRVMMQEWFVKQDGKDILFYDLSEDDFKDFPVGDAYINLTTYFRLVIQDKLPDIDKVIYLDCDTIVNGSLKELWNTEMGDYAVAGVRDRVNDSIRLYNRLRYPMHDGYVNAGVLLINLIKWREFHVFDRAKEIAKAMPEALKNHDQDIINILFHDNKLMLPFRYNLLEYYLYVEEWLYLDRKYYPEIIDACQNPVIIHFCMPQKPWHYECINPFKDLYYKYRKMTPWPEVELTHKIQRLSRKQKVKMLLGRLGLYHIESKPTLRHDVNIIEEPNNVLF